MVSLISHRAGHSRGESALVAVLDHDRPARLIEQLRPQREVLADMEPRVQLDGVEPEYIMIRTEYTMPVTIG